MKFIAAILVALAISAQADESEYNYYQTQHEHQHQAADPYAGYADSTSSFGYNAVSEKQDIDMDVILPIVVFGGLGLGALAYIESLNFRNQLCNKLREVTNVARANAATGTATANLVASGGITAAIATNVNNIVNGNKDFINAIAQIDNLDC